MRLGAGITLSQIAEDETVKADYPALKLAAEKAATPQIRNMATLGGNLAQRTRCWYFRSKYHDCYRKGSTTCFAQIGENQYHAIMENGDCARVHSSSLSTALMAFDGAVEIVDANAKVKLVSMEEFFVKPTTDPTRESILEAGEIITAVILPPVKEETKSAYLKMGERESTDWPIADVAVVAEVKEGGKCKKARIVLGAAAPVPLLSESAMNVINGQEITEALAAEAGMAAMQAATPLSKNVYKVQIFEALIKRTILALA